MKNKIINIVLIFVILFQVFYLRKYTFNENLFRSKYNKENNEFVFIHTDLVLDILLKDIDNIEDNNIFIHYNKDNPPYDEYGVGYLYYRYKLFPSYVPTIFVFDVDKDNNGKVLKDAGKLYDLGYVIIIGKNTEFFDYKTSKDFTLFHLNNKENNDYSLVSEIDLNLYDLYKYSKENDNGRIFNEFTQKVKNEIKDYWNFYCIDLIRNFALDLYKNNEYNLALEYGKYYLDSVDYTNELINDMFVDYYIKENNYEEAKVYFSNCIKNSECKLQENEEYKTILNID